MTGNGDVIGGAVQLSNSAFVPMTRESATVWTCEITPDSQSSGSNTLVALEVYTNMIGQHFTNYTTNIVVLYNDTVYISDAGNNNNDGTRLFPKRYLYFAASFASSMGIHHIKASGDFNRYNYIYWSDLTLDGGYAPDFLSQDISLYPSTMVQLEISRSSDVTIKNVHIAGNYYGVYANESPGLILSNCLIEPGNWPLRIYNTPEFTVIDSEIKDSPYGIFIVTSTGTFASNTVYSLNNQYAPFAPLYVYQSEVDIVANEFFNNEGTEGGAIKLYQSSGRMFNNYIHDNVVNYDANGGEMAYGGAIYDNASDYLISNNVIENNSSVHYSGGIYTFQSTSRVLGNTFIGNRGNNRGGGLLMTHGGGVIAGNMISNNSSGNYGGGLALRRYTGPVYNNIFVDNNSYYHGAGVWYYDGSTSVFSNNLVLRNFAGYYGGGLMMSGNALPSLFKDNSIISNVAVQGGGIWYFYPPWAPVIDQGEISYNHNYGLYFYGRVFTPVLNGVTMISNTPAWKYP